MAVGGADNVQPVLEQEDVKAEKSDANKLVEAIGIASCAEIIDK